jgi:hypothetical protein
MRKLFTRGTAILLFMNFQVAMIAQTVVPNGGFETWINHTGYEDPQSWDTPNQELTSIPFFGTTVVTKSTDHEAGSYSAKLETKHITLPPLDIPGVITEGNLTIDITSGSYLVTGGVPITDNPTHLRGFYKFLPKGGDSCLIAIGIFKTTAGVRDTIAAGYFSTHDTVNDWTPFSAWIDYLVTTQPDSMNIFALSSALEVPTPGTVLYLDEISLDYTVGVNEKDPAAGIAVYQDRETNRLLVFFDFRKGQETSLGLYNMTGQEVYSTRPGTIQKQNVGIPYDNLRPGIYILEVIHGNQKFTRKFIFNT